MEAIKQIVKVSKDREIMIKIPQGLFVKICISLGTVCKRQ